MSVRRWKQVISISVAVLLVTSVILAVVFGIKYNRLYHENTKPQETAAEIGEGKVETDEYENIIKYYTNIKSDENFAYKDKHPELYGSSQFNFTEPSEKTCYLTFDDGPDPNTTPVILDILKEYDVKATFFVVYHDSEDAKALYKRIVDEGHSIGIHSASHDYEKIYASVEAYLDDFARLSDHLEQITGKRPDIFRFPGGSINTYNSSIYKELIAEMIRRGYTYYDWNVAAGDAKSYEVSTEDILYNIFSADSSSKEKIILLHDGGSYQTTAEALPEIIERMQAKGYSFAPITTDVRPVVFEYKP